METGERAARSRARRRVRPSHRHPRVRRIPVPSKFMIRIGSDEQFSAVRNFLKSAYPDDSNILADRVGDFDPAKHGEEPPLVRLFFLGRAISMGEWEAVAPESIRAVFSDLGLTEAASNGRIRCSVLLYRSHDKYIVSDRFMSDEGVVGRPAE